ncbi:MAG: hypothetical protein KIS85_00650 [Anaerolineales bacterium]|nr:hypothetical protein [Anaerolineales bacterium]
MYWYRDGNPLSLLPWLAVMLIVWLAGWLLASHAFRLQSRERLIVGLGLGLTLYVWLVNLFGRWLAPELAFSLPAVLLLVVAALVAWRSGADRWLDPADLRIWPWLVVGFALFYLFMLWSKGLTLFDEHKNLSLISIIGNGNIPPEYLPGYVRKFAYHYGFHIVGGSLMQLGGMLPWSAFDLSKSFLWAITLLLAALVGCRYIGRAWGAWAIPALVALAAGTRYLLLILPPGFLLRADSEVQLQGTSALINKPFSEALVSPWLVDGGPPMDYIFGFLNGIMDPLVMAHQGPNTFSVLIFLLVWLLAPNLRKIGSAALLAVVLAAWALAWEATYGLFMLGLFGFAAIFFVQQRNLALPQLRWGLAAGVASAVLVLFQGGTITELLREFLFGYEGPGLLQSLGLGVSSTLPIAGTAASSQFFGFSLRWPLAIVSAHLGPLSLFSPVQLIVALFELGPVFLFTPWITRWAWHRAKAGDWLLGVLTCAAWLGFTIPIFFQYQSDRDISRLTWQAMLAWTLLLPLVIADRNFRWPGWLRPAAVGALALTSFSGLMIAGTQFSATSTTRLGENFNQLDSLIATQMWGKLPRDAHVMGPLGSTTILSGQLTSVVQGEPPLDDIYHRFIEQPTLQELKLFSYDFYYIDSRVWEELDPEIRATSHLDDECVVTFAEVWDNARINYRRMLDLRACTD